ncbi:MAG: cell division protein FtsL [Clostridiales bacterium]|nr:cell division protein FtsL [Clostridiales bacterium]
MASSVKNPRYGAGVTYGSLAYDYNKSARYHEKMDRPVERQIIIPAPPKIREEASAAARADTKQSVAPLAIIGYICAAILIVFSLMAKIQLTAVTDQSASFEQQLSELRVAQNRLLIDYEKAFNLTEIEEYASRELGMHRPRDEQVFYFDSAVPDKAVIIDGKDAKGGFGDRIMDALSSIAEYFR